MTHDCAVVIPIYKKPSYAEKLALEVGSQILSRYHHYIVMPEGLDYCYTNYSVVHLPDCYFVSVNAYARLLTEPLFYSLFNTYDYILIYQLDCLVFNDSLAEFCSLGLDYIAPLILARKDGFWPATDIVGVGGFSLRKVQSFLKVLDLLERPDFSQEATAKNDRINRNGAEDMFWGLAAPAIDPLFKVASPACALAFGFEGDPQKSFVRSGEKQPFGCHHWNNTRFLIWYLNWLWKLPGKQSFSIHRALLLFMALLELLFQDSTKFLLRVLRRLWKFKANIANTNS